MQLRNVKQRTVAVGYYNRPDGARFDVTATIYELPSQYNYWIARFDAAHSEWGHMGFQAIIPKKLAPTTNEAEAFIHGPITEQVKSSLNDASETGRNFSLVLSDDGWSLL